MWKAFDLFGLLGSLICNDMHTIQRPIQMFSELLVVIKQFAVESVAMSLQHQGPYAPFEQSIYTPTIEYRRTRARQRNLSVGETL